MKRRFIDAPNPERCAATVTLRDSTTARCGRRATHGRYCWQHDIGEAKRLVGIFRKRYPAIVQMWKGKQK